jgi:hypothetical protein
VSALKHRASLSGTSEQTLKYAAYPFPRRACRFLRTFLHMLIQNIGQYHFDAPRPVRFQASRHHIRLVSKLGHSLLDTLNFLTAD